MELGTPGNLKVGSAPEAMHPLAIDAPTFSPQERPDPPIPIARMAFRQGGQTLDYFVVSARSRLVLHRGPIGRHQSAGASFGDASRDQKVYRLPLVRRLYRFL